MTERTELIIGHARGILLLMKLAGPAHGWEIRTAALDGIRERLQELQRLTG